jgi:hypothetical protein
MAAPTSGPYGTTAVIYDPTGTDADPIGDGWTAGVSSGATNAWRRVSNQMAPSSGAGFPSQTDREGISYGLDVEFWCELAAKHTTGFIDLMAMITTPRTAGVDYYEFELDVSAGTDTNLLWKVTNNVGSSIATGTATEFSAGDYFAFSIKNDGSGNPVLEGWLWVLAGSSWTRLVNFTDTTGTKITSGFFGLEGNESSAGWRIGKIYGGAIPAGSVISSAWAQPRLGSSAVPGSIRFRQSKKSGTVFSVDVAAASATLPPKDIVTLQAVNRSSTW